MKWECQFAPSLNGWVVEAVGSDGECYVTQFYGPLCEGRAKAYSARMNSGEVRITCNDAGECVAVTRTDDEGQILSVIWERPDTAPKMDVQPEDHRCIWRDRYEEVAAEIERIAGKTGNAPEGRRP